MKSKKTYYILFFAILFCNFITIAQIDVFSDEVTHKNNLVYYQNIPLTGTLYSNDEETINNNCQCTLKETYKEGALDGLKQKWYFTGKKQYEGTFEEGKKINTHTFWQKNGNKRLEEIYTNNTILERKHYYDSGKLKSYFKYNLANGNVVHQKEFFENEVLKFESYFKNNVKHGIYIENYANGKPSKELVYDTNKIVKKNIYNENGFLIESLHPTTTNLVATELFYENGKQKIKGYYTKDFKKDSIWLSFDKSGNKKNKKVYKNENLIQEGNYVNNKKDGVWKYYLPNDVQKNTVYKNGEQIETKTFKITNLVKNNFNLTDDVAILEYTSPNGNKQIITLTSDQPFTENRNYQYILGAVSRSFLERMKKLKYVDIDDSAEISKRIHISNLKVSYTSENVKGHVSNQYFTTYNAYISLHLLMTDAEGKTLFSKTYSFNKSGKLLNAILNAAVQTYATNKTEAFRSALKSIKFKKLTKKYFPLK